MADPYKYGKSKIKSKEPSQFEKSKERVISQEFADPIQARSDSSRVFKAGGGAEYEPASDKKKREKKEVTTLRSRRQKLVEDIMESEMKITLPQNSDKVKIMQADIDAWYSELEEVSANLGEPYQRPSGDAEEGGGGFWKGVGDFLTPDPNPERDFKVKMTRDLNKQLAIGEIKIPPTWKRNQNKWIEKKVDEAWKSKQAEIPLEQQSIDELIKGAGTE